MNYEQFIEEVKLTPEEKSRAMREAIDKDITLIYPTRKERETILLEAQLDKVLKHPNFAVVDREEKKSTEEVYVKTRGCFTIKGELHAFDTGYFTAKLDPPPRFDKEYKNFTKIHKED